MALSSRSLVVLVAVTVAVWSLVCAPVSARGYGGGGLRNGFYGRSCPNVERIIYESMYESFQKDSSVAPGVLRMAYHDCFVRGCDASLLLTGPNSERANPINAGLHGFDAIDAAKAKVEEACPGIVSCADVLQYAVRDTVILTGGQGWQVPAGRKDGRVSISAEVPVNLMTPDKKVPVLLQAFQKKGLNAAQMVALQGAHTIGKAACISFDNRLWTYPSPSKVDPTLPNYFAKKLKTQCPAPGLFNRVDMDVVTPMKFDSQYYKNIRNSLGLFTSDQSMLYDARTSGQVVGNSNFRTFSNNFVKAMIALSKVDVLTGNEGEIRRVCSVVN